MQAAVILSEREQECLLRALESGRSVHDAGSFFLWAQGQLQAFLPHQIMVCLQFDATEHLQRIECVHAAAMHAADKRYLLDAQEGLVPRLARQWLAGDGLALAIDTAAQHG